MKSLIGVLGVLAVLVILTGLWLNGFQQKMTDKRAETLSMLGIEK